MSEDTCDRCGDPRDSRMYVDEEGAPHMRRVCCAALFSLDTDRLGRMISVAEERLQTEDGTSVVPTGHTWSIGGEVFVQVNIVEDSQQIDTFWFSLDRNGEFICRSSREMRIAELKAELQ